MFVFSQPWLHYTPSSCLILRFHHPLTLFSSSPRANARPSVKEWVSVNGLIVLRGVRTMNAFTPRRPSGAPMQQSGKGTSIGGILGAMKQRRVSSSSSKKPAHRARSPQTSEARGKTTLTRDAPQEASVRNVHTTAHCTSSALGGILQPTSIAPEKQKNIARPPPPLPSEAALSAADKALEDLRATTAKLSRTEDFVSATMSAHR